MGLRRHTGASTDAAFTTGPRWTHNEVTILCTDYLVSGFAEARLRDGTSGRLELDGAGWHAKLRGVELVCSPCRTWEEAARLLGQSLAAEHILLRLG